MASRQPDHVAVVLGTTRIRWKEWERRAACLASVLADAGVGHGSRVGQLMFNCPEYLESTFAAFKVRASTVNVNYRYKAAEIAHVLADSGATALVYHSAFADVVDEARSALPQLSLLLQVDDGDDVPLLTGATDYAAALRGAGPLPPIERSGSDSLILYTGGTTGLPKGVVWSHTGLFGALAYTGYVTNGLEVPTTIDDVARVAAELNAAGKSPVNLTAPPLMHGTALFLAISSFVLGGTVVMLGSRRFDAAELLRLIESERVTQASIVGDAFARPLVDELVRAEADGFAYDLTSLARIVSTGATFSAETKRSLMARAPHAAVIDMIGASEGGPFAVATTLPGQDPLDTAMFMATPTTVLFDDATWEKIPFGSDRSGVLGASGPMPDGYFGDPVKTDATFRVIDGIRYSIPGDYATIDSDGTVHLLGRGSVCINTGGEKVYPEEVEVAARSLPDIVDCVAIGIPDARMGEIVALVASRAAGSHISTDELVAFVKSRIADYKAPRVVVFIDHVYRSPSGKADYRWAREVVKSAMTAT